MPKYLTKQQEKFALEYVRTGVAANAYRAAYNVRPGTKPETVWSSASVVLSNPKVAERVSTLLAGAAASANISAGQMLIEMEQNRAFAQTLGHAGAAQAASRDRARILGYLDPGVAARADAAQFVRDNTTIEARNLYDLARRVFFTLELGRRRGIPSLPAPRID
jgi:hypothetical protein